jgi:GH15 family glucan-1,4-alpha-glucosidase
MLEEILAARQVDELTSTMWNLEWVARHAAPSGILSEQVDPHDGQMLSVSPLTWSHSTVVEVVMLYLLKLRELEVNRNVLHPLRCANLLRDSL